MKSIAAVPLRLAFAACCAASTRPLSQQHHHQTRHCEQSIRPVRWRLNCGPRGGTGGAKPSSGVQRFWGPLGASEFDPRFSNSGSRRPLPRGPLEPRKGSQGLGGGSSQASERGVALSTEREKKVGHSEASKRPRFPDAP